MSERRDEIARLAADLFAKKGFVATTVREIADEASILSGSLYHHFDSKEAILDEILTTFLSSLVASYRRTAEERPDPIDALQEMIRQSFASIDTYGSAVAILHSDWNYFRQYPRFAYLLADADKIQKIWVGVLQQGIDQGRLRPDLDPWLVYRFVRDAVWVAVRWYQPEGRYCIDEIADSYIRMLLAGISAGRRSASTSGARGVRSARRGTA